MSAVCKHKSIQYFSCGLYLTPTWTLSVSYYMYVEWRVRTPSPVVQVVLWSAGWVLMAAHKLARSRAAREYHRPFFNSPPPGWIGPVFTPRLDFPLAVDVNNSDAAPSSGGSGDLHDCKWEAIDFREEPERYLQTVLEYCFDGNVESDFVPQKNSKRSWYHAPWMSHGKKGREPFHGLTFEKPAKPGYLAEDQQSVAQTWAVAFYNERGEALCIAGCTDYDLCLDALAMNVSCL